jgi:hypothetical protein
MPGVWNVTVVGRYTWRIDNGMVDWPKGGRFDSEKTFIHPCVKNILRYLDGSFVLDDSVLHRNDIGQMRAISKR